CKRRAIAHAIHFRSRRIDDRPEIVQTFFIRGVSSPINGVTTELMFAAKVVNFGAREYIALSFKEQEQTQLARFVTRNRHPRPAIIRNREGAVAVNDLEIDGHAGTNFKLIAHPK